MAARVLEEEGHPRILKGIVCGKRTLGRWYIDTYCILEQSSNVYIPVKYKEVSILSHWPYAAHIHLEVV
tara:strand:+ start:143 stop:349 length:207 start_codon:yes stop_codon:yes gene_type:complete